MRDYYIPPRTTVLPPYEHKRYQPPNIYETQPEYRTNQVDLNRIAEYNRNFGPCSPGFERNYLGACVGKCTLFNIELPVVYPSVEIRFLTMYPPIDHAAFKIVEWNSILIIGRK